MNPKNNQLKIIYLDAWQYTNVNNWQTAISTKKFLCKSVIPFAYIQTNQLFPSKSI